MCHVVLFQWQMTWPAATHEVRVLPLPALQSNQSAIKRKADKALCSRNPWWVIRPQKGGQQSQALQNTTTHSLWYYDVQRRWVIISSWTVSCHKWTSRNAASLCLIGGFSFFDVGYWSVDKMDEGAGVHLRWGSKGQRVSSAVWSELHVANPKLRWKSLKLNYPAGFKENGWHCERI